MECDRCGEDVNAIFPLDNAEGSDEVCEDCLKPTDEVVEL